MKLQKLAYDGFTGIYRREHTSEYDHMISKLLDIDGTLLEDDEFKSLALAVYDNLTNELNDLQKQQLQKLVFKYCV